jgi:hypothetical protein
VQSKTIVVFVVGTALGFAVSQALEVLSAGRFAIPVPARPSGVPHNAHWSGGPDGGNWFDCVHANLDIWSCSVYADVTGVLVASGKYKLTAQSEKRELVPILLMSDDEIQLSGARLVKIRE